MKYLCLVYLEKDKWSAVPDRECAACGESFHKSGVLLAAEPLERVEIHNGFEPLLHYAIACHWSLIGDVRRALHIVPLVQILTVRAEELDAVVLPVRDQHAPVRRHRDAVDEVELARPGARLAFDCPIAFCRTSLPAGKRLLNSRSVRTS